MKTYLEEPHANPSLGGEGARTLLRGSVGREKIFSLFLVFFALFASLR